MNGLEQIRAINATAQAEWEDRQRQSKGYKPKTPLAAILRKHRGSSAVHQKRVEFV